MQDSNYTITKDIYNEIGGDPNEHFDSVYSIALAILKKMKGGKPSLQALNAVENGVYTPEGFDGYSEVTVAVPEKTFTTEEKTVEITKNGATIILKSENVDGMTKVTANVNVQPNLQEATLAVWENHKKYEIVPEANFDGISKAFVDVNVPEPVIEENKTLDITNNGSYTMTPSQNFDAIKMGTIHVNVPQTGGPNFDGTGYNAAAQAAVNNKLQADLDYTKQKFAEWDPSNIYASYLYHNDKKLVYAPAIDMSNVTDTSYMFNRCSSLTTIPDGFNCPETTYTGQMFYQCSSLTTLPDGFSCPKTTNTYQMFYECSSLTTLPDGFNCPLTTNTQYMFRECSSLTTLPDGFSCPEATTTSNMFQNCDSLITLPDGFNCPLTTDVSNMFQNCDSLKSLPKLDFGKTTNIGYFFGYNNINTLTDLGGFTGLKIDWNDGGGLNACPNLTKQSVLNVINELYDFRANGDASTTKTIKFHANSLALLSEDEKLIATNKGWNLVS